MFSNVYIYGLVQEKHNSTALLRSANERRRYKVTPSLIGQAQ